MSEDTEPRGPFTYLAQLADVVASSINACRDPHIDPEVLADVLRDSEQQARELSVHLHMLKASAT